MLPLLRDHRTSWRQRALLECIGRYIGVRSKKAKLVNFAKGRREWYDLKRDPFELRNRCRSSSRSCAPRLASYLNRLATCQGRECWEIETE